MADALSPDERRVVISMAEVSKTYPAARPVTALVDATLEISTGEMVAITGPSGSGKSTLLNILGLLDTATGGRYAMDGVDVRTLGERERTRLRATRLGFVFQSFHLVPYLSCLRNVQLPLVHTRHPRNERRELAERALRSVGLGHRIAARPTTLSGGERQRVALARAVVHQPSVLLCDEPTGNLDSANTGQVMDLLRALVTPERTVVVVTHERDVAERADRELRVVDGRVVG
ncbi:ABC transporter ATP-binding protein [Streptomyces sp. NPDC094032]|uniref:ABC transporter ATP-binding protein n=1 Tax=Streptomyces sp. NPDC094032 TaxID=3155308 RepID=UPI0033288C88